MSKKISLGAAIAFAVIVAAATFSITMVLSARQFNDGVNSLMEREKMYGKIAEVDSCVRQNYIGSITENELRDTSATGYLRGIGDSYAQYFDAAEYQEMKDGYGDKSVQIGIVTKMDDSGYMKVIEVYPESPAQAAGIEVDDLIVKIDDTDITSGNYNQDALLLYGEAGTKMNIVLRKGVEDMSLEMTRRFVEIPSLSSMMLSDNVGLVKVKEFNDTTPDQFTKLVDKLIDDGAAALIFDVRSVTQSTLGSVAQVLDKLLPEGVLVSSTDKNGKVTVLETSDAREVKLPMAVVTNEKTTGEAELFAAVIRDYQKGKLIGAKTAGKGTAQQIFPLTDGSAIKITTARYVTPAGQSYDGEGLKPDFEVKMTEEQVKMLENPDITSDSQMRVENDPQLKKAMEVALAGIRSAEGEGSSSTASSSTAASSKPEPPVSSAAEPVASVAEEPQESEAEPAPEAPQASGAVSAPDESASTGTIRLPSADLDKKHK